MRAAAHDGLGPHAVLLLTEQGKPLWQTISYVRSRGSVVCIRMADTSVGVPVFDAVTRMVSVKGSYVGSRLDTQEAVEFFRRGYIRPRIRWLG